MKLNLCPSSHLSSHLVAGGTYLLTYLSSGFTWRMGKAGGGVGVARAVGKCCCGSRTDSAVMRRTVGRNRAVYLTILKVNSSRT